MFNPEYFKPYNNPFGDAEAKFYRSLVFHLMGYAASENPELVNKIAATINHCDPVYKLTPIKMLEIKECPLVTDENIGSI